MMDRGKAGGGERLASTGDVAEKAYGSWMRATSTFRSKIVWARAAGAVLECLRLIWIHLIKRGGTIRVVEALLYILV